MAQEFANSKDDELFAGTSPLRVLRLLLSDGASLTPWSKIILIMDVKCAFLYGAAKGNICISLTEQDPLHEGRHLGLLKRSMYGTRDAPQVWQEDVERHMRKMGFKVSQLHPAIDWHTTWGLFVIAHVDDFICTGPEASLEWFRGELSQQWELKPEFVGPGPQHQQEAKFLNRTIRCASSGLELEADPRHIRG